MGYEHEFMNEGQYGDVHYEQTVLVPNGRMAVYDMGYNNAGGHGMSMYQQIEIDPRGATSYSRGSRRPDFAHQGLNGGGSSRPSSL